MNPLSAQEKEQLARLLSYNTTVGGWFLLFMAGLIFVIWSLPLVGIINLTADLEEFLIGFFVLGLAFFLPGLWMLRRRKKVRGLLDGPLEFATAEVLAVDQSDPSNGLHAQLLVQTPNYQEVEAFLTIYGRSPWSVGEKVELLFLADGVRFFPRHLDFRSSFGTVQTPEQVDKVNIRKAIILIVLGSLVLLGALLAAVASLNNQ